MEDYSYLSTEQLKDLHTDILNQAEAEHSKGNDGKALELIHKSKDIRIEMMTRITNDRDLAEKIVNHEKVEVL